MGSNISMGLKSNIYLKPFNKSFVILRFSKKHLNIKHTSHITQRKWFGFIKKHSSYKRDTLTEEAMAREINQIP